MLVAKTITVGTTPVEILPGEDVSQSYALWFGAGRGSGVRVGDSSVTMTDGFDPTGFDKPLETQGVSFWVVSGGSVDLNILAYSTPE